MLVIFHEKKVREALEAPITLGIDLLLLAALTALIGGLVYAAQEATAPFRAQVDIPLNLLFLPVYTFLSLVRGFAAYGLSLLFTLVYGTIAAHNRRAEKVMIPALDILQSIPVLAFLPGLVLVMIRWFPSTELGLELACVVMIFTGQAWNMTFSFHGSLRSIPTTLREVATLQSLSWWRTFKLLEVPAAMIGLVWNSMMSMAGGWFFLITCEAFTLKNRDYRVPGIGSYMNEAIHQGNTRAMMAAVIAMVVMIVVVDQLVWRPVVVWAQRFKLEDQGGETPRSWFLEIIRRSHWYQIQQQKLFKTGATLFRTVTTDALGVAAKPIFKGRQQQAVWSVVAVVGAWASLIGLGLVVLWGGFQLLHLMYQLPGREWLSVVAALIASFLRVSAAVALGVAWTLPAGILIGLSPRWSRRLQPVIQVVASFPAPMLFPLVTLGLLFLHIPFTIGCVALMLVGTQWYILFNVIAGAIAIPEDLKVVARVYRFTRWETWKHVYLPCVYPYLVTGLITAMGGAWNATIVSEYMILPHHDPFRARGLGERISYATETGNFPLLAASVTVMALFVVLLNRLVWKRLYRIAEQKYSLNT